MHADWQNDSHSLTRTFSFANFSEAMQFIQKVGELAEKHQHHPDIFLHDYCKVTLTLTTHDAGGVTQKDTDLAMAVDEI